MAFTNHPLEEPEKSLWDYASPRCEDIKVQELDLKLEATKYEIKARTIEMAETTPFRGMETENPYRHIKNFRCYAIWCVKKDSRRMVQVESLPILTCRRSKNMVLICAL
jgi:hypothetical protein